MNATALPDDAADGELHFTKVSPNASPNASAATNPDSAIVIRTMTGGDLPAALTLSEDVRWPHRMGDWNILFELGEGRVAEADGELVGIGLRWAWGEHAATVGLVIVAPGFRGRQVGRRLIEALCAELDGRKILLYATDRMHPLYERLGFVEIAEVRQYLGKVLQPPLMALPADARLRPAGRNDLDLLVALDTQACELPRERLLKAWLGRAIGAVVLDQADQATGFGIVRRFGGGAAIGPVVAPDADSAKAMIAHLAGLANGRVLRVDVDARGELGDWLESCGLACVGQAVVLGRGDPLPLQGELRSFALAAQVLG